VKIRNGMVSNSSSSSFLLAIDSEKKLELLHLVLKGIPQKNFNHRNWLYGGGTTVDNVGDMKLVLLNGVKNLKTYEKSREVVIHFLQGLKDKPTARQAIATWISMDHDPNHGYVDVGKMVESPRVKNYIREDKKLSHAEVEREIDSEFDSELYRQENNLEKIRHEITEAQSLLSQIEEYKLSDETTIMVIEVDNWDTKTIRTAAKSLDILTLHEIHT